MNCFSVRSRRMSSINRGITWVWRALSRRSYRASSGVWYHTPALNRSDQSKSFLASSRRFSFLPKPLLISSRRAISFSRLPFTGCSLRSVCAFLSHLSISIRDAATLLSSVSRRIIAEGSMKWRAGPVKGRF